MKYRTRTVKLGPDAAEDAHEERVEEADAQPQVDDQAQEQQRAEQIREVAAALQTEAPETVRERLQALVGRQGRLPLEVEESPPPARGSSRLTETREQLIQRLLDPTLSLQEAAVLLGVCPTTVRRYTNRGALRCFRTPGNQRRFRLSDVLDFMEHRQNGEI